MNLEEWAGRVQEFKGATKRVAGKITADLTLEVAGELDCAWGRARRKCSRANEVTRAQAEIMQDVAPCRTLTRSEKSGARISMQRPIPDIAHTESAVFAPVAVVGNFLERYREN